jgi:lipid II:glycine glycyltransferase (peptidoglycan interpeptide bridge formation enzyme)
MNTEIRRTDLRNLSEKELAEINSVLNQSEESTIFHTIEWNQLLIDYYGLQHTVFIAFVEDEPVGYYVYYDFEDKTYRSPAVHLQSTYGGPVVVNGNTNAVVELLRACERVHPTAYFQIWSAPNVNPAPFSICGYDVQNLSTPVIQLNCSESELWSGVHRKKRTSINKAKRLGAVVEEAGINNLETYHKMVSDTLAKDEVSSLPIDYLRRILECLVPLGLARFFLVRYQDKVISGAIVLYYKKNVYGWDMGWRREYSNLSPNDLLNWEVAREASRIGYEKFDLLRFEPDRLPGIAKWKERFGVEIIPCYYFRKATLALRLTRTVKIMVTDPQRALKKIVSVFRKTTDNE